MTSLAPVRKHSIIPHGLDVGQYPPCLSNTADQPIEPPSVRMGTSAQLSLEVIEYILGFLHSDNRALCNCSLVCHSWYLSSQKLLCYSIVIRDRKDLNGFLMRPFSVRKAVFTYTHELEVNATQDNIRSRNALAMAPRLLGSLMANLQRLRLRSCMYAPFYPGYLTSFISLGGPLVHLQLIKFALPNPSFLIGIISRLPKLLELELELGTVSCSLPICNEKRTFQQSRRVHLHYMNDLLLHPLADWILSQAGFRHVTNLSYKAEQMVDSSEIFAGNGGVTTASGPTDNVKTVSSLANSGMKSIVRAIGPSLTTSVYHQGYNCKHLLGGTCAVPQCLVFCSS